jgi:hypothetical protein
LERAMKIVGNSPGFGQRDLSVRSYVMAPQKFAKDLRTGITLPIDDVLDGKIDGFLTAALTQRIRGHTKRRKVTVTS